MAFEDPVFNMNDPRLKPRLLQSIMMAHLPDEKQLPRSPAQLAVAVASIRRHHLLCETPSSGSAVSKSGDPRKGAVDSWVEHLMGLLCSTVAENRWAGLCLLGVMCQECSRQRFLDFYSSWSQKLLLALKQSTDPVFIRAAACASLTDLLTRLGTLIEAGGVRREGSALIAKLVQPILQILGDKDSSGIWNEAIDLLTSILRYFPSSLRQQSNNLESLLVARLMDCDSPSLSKKFALCLALLPKTHGDAAIWSSMIRRILIAINRELEYAFAGMEDVATAEDALAALLPMGQDPPWPLGGPSVAANASAQATKGFWQQLVPRVGALLQCCQYLLTIPYQVPVPVPIGPLLALAIRILRVDGSRLAIPSPLGGAVSSVHQVSLCSEIPALHLGALDLLTAVLCGVRSQLLPHAGDVVRLVSEYFRRWGTVAPALRVKLYEFAAHLFVAMGAGMAAALARPVVVSAIADLRGSTGAPSGTISPKSSRTPRTNNVSSWTPAATPAAWNNQPTSNRKRKDPGGVPVDHQSNGVAETSTGGSDGTASATVQMAALRALEALLTSGGAMIPDRWRTEVDTVLISVAMGAASGMSSCASVIFDEDSTYVDGGTGSTTAFQVAAYKALLASLLSPCSHRPPYLSHGLAIFKRGRQEAGSEVAQVCAHALLALDPLIHPRCLPPAVTALTTTRSTSTGLVVPQMQRQGKPLAGAPSVPSGVATSAGTMSFAGPVASPTAKVAQPVADPWAEVDAFFCFREDLGEEDALFYEDDSILGDEFNGAMDAGGVYFTPPPKQDSTNGHSATTANQAGITSFTMTTSLARTADNASTPMPPSDKPDAGQAPLHIEESLHGELVPQTTIEQDAILREAYDDAGLRNDLDPSVAGSPSQADNESDSPLHNKPEILFSPQLQGLDYSDDSPTNTNKTSSPDLAAGGMDSEHGKLENEEQQYLDDGIPTDPFLSLPGPKTPVMPNSPYPNEAGQSGSESDSDGVLPDIINAEPDSD